MKFNKSKAYKSAALGVAGTLTALAIPLATTSTASASGMNWDRVAACESGGNWSTNTGNGFYGGLQFTSSTWRAYGGHGSANHASRAEQIAVAERVLAAQGPGAWPVCSRGAGHASRSTVRHSLPKRTVSHHRVVKHSRHRVVRHHALRHHKHHYRVVKHHRQGVHHHVVRHHR